MPLDRLEKEDEDKFAKELERRGYLALKIKVLSRVGWPDRMVPIKGGRVIWYEFKAIGEEPRKSQLKIHRFLKKFGHKVYVVHTYEEAIKIFKRKIRTR